MSWQEKVLENQKARDVAQGIVDALECLLTSDAALLETDAHEQTITSRLAHHLQKAFPEWHVDSEYNRDRDKTKKLGQKNVKPDVIVHRRGEPNNLLVIEAKKSNSHGADEGDLMKLESFKGELNYRFALFVKFDVSSDAPGITEVRWV